MPIYKWSDKNTGKEVEIIRSFDDYEDTPTEEEALVELTKEEFKNAKWVKIVVGGSRSIGFGRFGHGGKGNW